MIDPLSVFLLLLGAATPILLAALGELVVERAGVLNLGVEGMMIGGAQMSPMHCNFMINTGQASGYELEYLGETVRQRVMETSGIKLDWEIKRIGTFMPGYEVREFLGRATA